MSTARPFLARRSAGSNVAQQTCHNSLMGFGLCRMVANGKWPSQLCFAKTNYLELLALFIALKHSLPFLHHCHILISCDSFTTIPHISHRAESRAAAESSACVTSAGCSTQQLHPTLPTEGHCSGFTHKPAVSFSSFLLTCFHPTHRCVRERFWDFLFPKLHFLSDFCSGHTHTYL